MGAGLVATALLGTATSLLISALGPRDWPLPPAVGATRFAGVALGAGIAAHFGGRRAIAWYGLSLLAIEMFRFAAGTPARAAFCERAGEPCPLPGPGETLVTYWPLAAGLLVAPLTSRVFARGEGRTNPSLEAAGAFGIGSALLQLTAIPVPISSEPDAQLVVWSVASLVPAAGAGHLLVRRGAPPWPRGVATAAAIFVLPWTPSLLRYAEFRGTAASAQVEWLMVSPLVFAAVFLLAAVITAALARSQPPDAGAARRGPR
ncbi:MAG TPA: hypothetical protein VFW12_04730 [Candidatus Limnocylindria bacterium]|nr:hypothetical protein [Candidatus Limnocylindria bacterium]